MGLENTFQNVKKLPEEKKLEAITSEAATFDELRAYFEQNKYEGWHGFTKCKNFFNSYMDFLQNLKVTPKTVSEFIQKCESERSEALGLYLSAMIQTSYNQEHNNFKFEDVHAHCFGAFLKGQPKKPIKIKTKSIKGTLTLWKAENCALKAKDMTVYNLLWGAKTCSVKTVTIDEACSLWLSNGCLAEITNYQGRNFGYRMKNCTIKSKNKETLETIKKQVEEGENNKFKLK